MDQSGAKMARLTAGVASKSAKMRKLAEAGYSRGEIAKFLDTRYQFVRNVLLAEEARKAKESVAVARAAPEPREESPYRSRKVRIESGGCLTLPGHVLEDAGFKEGDVLVASVEDGEVRLRTMSAALRRAQEIVRQYVPEGVSLVDELLEDRRREAEQEERNG